MGVYIKGMKMPEHGCNNCRFRAGNYCSFVHGPGDCTKYARLNQKRPDCPLVHVPPHGDLVDRTEAIRAFVQEYGYATRVLSDGYFSKMPAIIPAEEANNG